MKALGSTSRKNVPCVLRSVACLFAVLLAAGAAALPAPAPPPPVLYVTGRVVDAVTRSPLAGAAVAVGGATTRTDADGVFELQVPPSAGLVATVSLPGYTPVRLTLAPGPSGPLTVPLRPAVSYTDRVEVTANRAREGEDPVTFTNIPREVIDEQHWAQDPAMLLADVAPGFYAYSDNGNGIGYSYFSIRGFSQARTRVTLNGAPLNDAESGELFFVDLADFLSTAGDVQIQRGVFGLSGIGGAVDITTAAPALRPSFTLRAGAGSYGTHTLTAHYESGLLGGAWALSARYSRVTTDGYRDQSWVDMWNAYLSLARFGERSRVRIILFGGPEKTHLAYEGVPADVLHGGLTGDAGRDRRTNPLSYPGEIDTFTQPHLQIVHELQIGPATRLEETFFAFLGNGSYHQYKRDRSLAEYNLPDVPLPGGGSVTTSDLVRKRSVDEWDAGWVPTLSRTTGAWTLTARGQVRVHEARHEGAVTWARAYEALSLPDTHYYDYRVSKRSASLLLTATWTPVTTLSIQGGVELSQASYRLHDDELEHVAFTDRFDFVLPRLGAVLRIAPASELYVNVARGMRPPGFSDLYDPEDPYAARAFLAPEDVWDWEAGVSSRGASWRARANVFWMDFANEIVYAGALDDNGVPVYGNGARSVHRGVELDAGWSPAGGFSADGTVTLSRNTFTRYREYGWDGSTAVYDGNRIAGFPDVLATLAARWRGRFGTVMIRGRHVGRFFLDNSEDNVRDPFLRLAPGYVPLINPAYDVVDAAVTLPLPRAAVAPLGLATAEVTVRVNNLLDERYTAFGYVDTGIPLFMPAAGRNVFVSLALGL